MSATGQESHTPRSRPLEAARQLLHSLSSERREQPALAEDLELNPGSIRQVV